MTDKEMLVLCHDAFFAMKTADNSNKFLRVQKEEQKTYAGSGQFKLRRFMLDKLGEHLELG